MQAVLIYKQVVEDDGSVTAPTLDNGEGRYEESVTVKVSNYNSDYSYYYRTDGEYPTVSDTYLYNNTTGITISSYAQLYMFAYKDGVSSDTIAAEYTIYPAAPVFALDASQTYATAQTLSLSNYNSNYMYIYTDNGETPSYNPVVGNEFENNSLSLNTTKTIKMIAVNGDEVVSSVASATYNFGLTPPTLSLAEGTYVGPQNVTVTNVQDGYTYYYTIGNGDITTYDATTGINITNSGKLSIYASNSDGITSSVVEANYTIKAVAPILTPAAGTYTEAITVKVSNYDENAVYTYKIDGGTETDYDDNTGIALSNNCTLAVYVLDGNGNDNETTAEYVFKILQGLEITGTPTTSYYVGDTFSTNGLSVTATYANGNSETVEAELAVSPSEAFAAAGTVTVTVSASYGGMSASQTYTVAVTEKPAARTFTKVTSTDDLEDGAEYVILNAANTYAASNYIDSKNRIAAYAQADTTYSLVDNIVTIPSGSNVEVYTFVQSGDNWKIKNSANSYLNSATSDVKIITGSEGEFTIAISDGAATIRNTQQTERAWMHNSVSSTATATYFANYSTNTTSSNYSLLTLYKSTTAKSPLSSISVDATNATTEFYTNDTFSSTGAVVTATYEDESTKVVTNSATFTAPDMTTVGEKTVTVSYTEGGVTKTATYTINVVERPKYTVTIETPVGGTLEVKAGDVVVNSGDQIDHGTVLTVTATANDGYTLRNWQAVDATTHTFTTGTTYTIDGHDVTIKANFDVAEDGTTYTIAEYQQLDDATSVTFKLPATVLAQYGRYLYVTDGTGYMLVFGSTGQTYSQGDVIPAGYSGTKATYGGEPELQSPSGFEASTSTTEVTAEQLESVAQVASAYFAHYVVLNNVTLTTGSGSNFTITKNDNTCAGYTSLGVSLPSDLTVSYNIYGIVGSYGTSSVVYQFLPLAFELYDADAPVFAPGAQPFATGTSHNIKVANYNSSYTYYYTTDGNDPTTSSEVYSNADGIDLTTTTTLKMIAVGQDYTSTVTSATYTFKTPVTIAQYQAIYDYDGDRNTGETCIFANDVTVIGQYGDMLYVKDDTGYMLIYCSVGKTYSRGDIIPAGFYGTIDSYYTEPCLKEAGGFEESTGAEEVVPDETQGASDYGHSTFGHYLVATGAQFTSLKTNSYGNQYGTIKLSNGETIEYYCNMGVEVPSDYSGKTYDIYGIVKSYYLSGSVLAYDLVITHITSADEETANSVYLADLCAEGIKGVKYVLADEQLKVVTMYSDQAGNNYILVKDEGNKSISKVTNSDNLEDYVIKAASYYSNYTDGGQTTNSTPQTEYDQSNWLEVLLPSGYDASSLVNNYIAGSQIEGTYFNTVNPRLVLTTSSIEQKSAGTAYSRNAMAPANFIGSQSGYFFMTPKRNELVQVVWAVYHEGAFYCPEKSEDFTVNGNGFEGYVSIGSLDYNSVQETGVQNGYAYQFTAVAKVIDNTDSGDHGESGDNAENAPRREMTTNTFNYHPTEHTSRYELYPLNLAHTETIVTGVDGVNEAKAVARVRYYNLQGVQLNEMQDGINIIVTDYTDGSHMTMKVRR